MALLNAAALPSNIVSSQLLPDEGPRAMPLLLDFSATGEQDLDLLLPAMEAQFSMIQGLYIDMSGVAANALTVQVQGTGQVIIAKAKTQGYYPILAPNPVKIKFFATSGTTPAIPVTLINFPMPPFVWATA